MVQQPVKVWICRKREPYNEFVVIQDEKEVRKARKNGFKCRRWKKMEEVENRA